MKELFENNRDYFKKKLRHVMAESEVEPRRQCWTWRLNQLASVV